MGGGNKRLRRGLMEGGRFGYDTHDMIAGGISAYVSINLDTFGYSRVKKCKFGLFEGLRCVIINYDVYVISSASLK